MLWASRVADTFRSSLQARVIALMVTIFVSVSIPAYFAFDHIIGRAVTTLGTMFAETQVQFDRYRGLETLMREVSLAETLSRSPAIAEWAADEDAPEKRQRALAELEHYRLSFDDQSYFFVIHDSGNYYFNDRDNTYAGRQLRYTVERDNPRDGWYFATIAEPSGCRLNVDHDDVLAVTKVWINCTVVADGRILGVAGTGIELTSFIREVVDVGQPGVESIFVDRSGAIQAHRDPRLIDFHSLTKDIGDRTTIFTLLDRSSDREAVAAMLKRVEADGAKVASRFVMIQGREVLAGIGYLDRIGWFNVTLMDLSQVIDRGVFRPIGALLAAMLAAAAALATILFKRSVLDRVALLERWVSRVRSGDYRDMSPRPATDEIGRLVRAFGEMADSIGQHTHQLEAQVRERTERLERLAHIDVVTDIYNRRGFLHAAEIERVRARRDGKQVGIILIDVDRFKGINDRYGHHVGDLVLAQIAERLTSAFRSYDIVGRWGGDEFIVLASVSDAEALMRMAEKAHEVICDRPIVTAGGANLRLTASVGACLPGNDASIDTIVAQADAAMYAAKRMGRNRVTLYEPSLDTNVRKL